MGLFDRRPADQDAELLGTGLVWRLAEPAVSTDTGDAISMDERSNILVNMPAVEVYDVTCADGKQDGDYPFTSAFYESAAYAPYRKRHFPDYIVPCSMREAASCGGPVQRSFLLWDLRYMKCDGTA